MSTEQESHKTTDHDTIKKWVEERNGNPAVVKDTESSGKGGGLLRISFPNTDSDDLRKMDWDEFFEIFDNNDLQFLYQKETEDGEQSRFCKFVD